MFKFGMDKKESTVVRNEEDMHKLLAELEEKGYRWGSGELPTEWNPVDDAVMSFEKFPIEIAQFSDMEIYWTDEGIADEEEEVQDNVLARLANIWNEDVKKDIAEYVANKEDELAKENEEDPEWELVSHIEGIKALDRGKTVKIANVEDEEVVFDEYTKLSRLKPVADDFFDLSVVDWFVKKD